jgi:predicted small lipoprotein YifL
LPGLLLLLLQLRLRLLHNRLLHTRLLRNQLMLLRLQLLCLRLLHIRLLHNRLLHNRVLHNRLLLRCLRLLHDRLLHNLLLHNRLLLLRLQLLCQRLLHNRLLLHKRLLLHRLLHTRLLHNQLRPRPGPPQSYVDAAHRLRIAMGAFDHECADMMCCLVMLLHDTAGCALQGPRTLSDHDVLPKNDRQKQQSWAEMATDRSTCGDTLAGSKPFQRPPPLGGYRTPDPPFYFRRVALPRRPGWGAKAPSQSQTPPLCALIN